MARQAFCPAADWRYYRPMRLLPRDTPATAAGWPDLTNELDRWGEAGRIATLWWRDDDAATASARLDRLLSIAGNVPIPLPAIPAAADPRLRSQITTSPRSTNPSLQLHPQ